MAKRALFSGLFAAGLALCMVAALTTTNTAQVTAGSVRIDNDDIGGVVTGPRGPEAGVWVIAETTDLPTRFVKIVVTDDAGRYVVPDLPKASYRVWVRGYGLVDTPKVQATPGKLLNLTAVAAPDPRAAAQYYPAGYWLSLMRVPDKSEFPGTGPDGNGISPGIKTQEEWIRSVKSGHQRDTRDSREPRHLQVVSGRLGPAHPVRTGRRADERWPQPDGPVAGAGDVRRLDRQDCSRRSPTGATPASGGGAQRRDQRVGLGRPEGISPR
jgi:hypothetical protein